MASSLALKRLVSGNLLSRSFRPLCSAAPVASSRLFNTGCFFHPFIDDVFSPFPFPSRKISEMFNIMDKFYDSDCPFAVSNKFFSDSDRPFAAVGFRSVVRETDEGVHIKLDLPGLGKENVKLSVQKNTLMIKGKSPSSVEGKEDSRRKVSSKIELPEKIYKIDAIKAEMKNGVLRVFVPKVKEEDKTTDVFNVKVE